MSPRYWTATNINSHFHVMKISQAVRKVLLCQTLQVLISDLFFRISFDAMISYF